MSIFFRHQSCSKCYEVAQLGYLPTALSEINRLCNRRIPDSKNKTDAIYENLSNISTQVINDLEYSITEGTLDKKELDKLKCDNVSSQYVLSQQDYACWKTIIYEVGPLPAVLPILTLDLSKP